MYGRAILVGGKGGKGGEGGTGDGGGTRERKVVFIELCRMSDVLGRTEWRAGGGFTGGGVI